MLDRYTLPQMADIWREEEKFRGWLVVELAVLKARMDLGQLAPEAYEAIREHANFTVNRIAELEAEYDHDMLAFIGAVQEWLEDKGAGAYKDEFHKGLTSYDVEDPAAMLQLRRAAQLVLKEMLALADALERRSVEHQWTLMIGRTHGQSAEPDTFGRLLRVYEKAVRRSTAQIQHMLQTDLSAGKMSGAIGTYAGMDPEVERKALGELGLHPASCETQILQRDRHARFFSTLATAAGTIEQIARTFWEMMRSDVGELQEPRRKKQRGSSAMPHKRNPILTERLMGMARLMRAYAGAAQENIATPEGRDISQSCVERVISVDATTLLHYMAVKTAGLVNGLVVFPDRMQENLSRTRGTWAGQPLKVALIEAGVPFDIAYEYVQRTSFHAADTRIQLADVARETPLSDTDPRTAADILGLDRLQTLFDPMAYVREGVVHIFNG